MDIRPEPGPDQVARRRIDERAVRRQAPGGSAREESSASADAVDMRRSQSVERLVAALRSSEPVDIHRIEDLRARIADGSYQARPEELVDGLLAVIDGTDTPVQE